jgi:hypothetical protein
MTDEDHINERLLAVLQLLDSIPLSSPEQGERALNEVTDIMRDPGHFAQPPGSGGQTNTRIIIPVSRRRRPLPLYFGARRPAL